MAEFKAGGIDELMLSLQEIASIPADVQDEMLNAQADVVVAAQQAKGRAYGVEDTGLTLRKIGKTRVKLKKGVRVIYVYPQGSRRRGKITTRNAEIAFVNEYGKRGHRARPFIRDANAESEKQTTEAAAAVFDRWLTSKNL